MAIDSRNKRASAIVVANPWRLIHPNPFGTIDAAARLQVGWSYKGSVAGAPFVLPEALIILTAGTHPRALMAGSTERALVSGTHPRALTGPTHKRDLTGPTHPRTLTS